MYGMLEFKDVIYSQRTPYSKIKSNDNRNIPDKIGRFFKGEIENSMFEKEQNLLNVIIPENITKIGSYAFGPNVKSIEFRGKIYTNKCEFNDMCRKENLCMIYNTKHRKIIYDVWIREKWNFC